MTDHSSTTSVPPEVWQDREVRFDVDHRLLYMIPGEVTVERVEQVEDTKGNNGDRGVLRVTNLRLIWHAALMPRINLSIGWNTVSGVYLRQAQSRARGAVDSMYVLCKSSATRYEFIFTCSDANQTRAYATITSVSRAYDTTKFYRELKMRGPFLDDNEQLRLLPGEEQCERLEGVWNLSTDTGNLGVMFISTLRLMWHASTNPQYNVSIPYMQLVSIATRESKFGRALVLETSRSSGEYVLGFRVDPEERLATLTASIQAYHRAFLASPFYGVQVRMNGRDKRVLIGSGGDQPTNGSEPSRSTIVDPFGNPLTGAPVVPNDDDVEAYFSDGQQMEGPRPPIFSEELGLAVEQLKPGYTLHDLWHVNIDP